MVKVRRIAGKAVSLILAVTMFASLIDTRAFADAGAVSYEGTEYDTIKEALEDATENEDKDIKITVNGNMEITETITVESGTKLSVTAYSQATFLVKDDIEALYIKTDGEVTLNGIILDGNREADETRKSNHAVENYGTLKLINSKIANFNTSKSAIKMKDAELDMDKVSSISNNENGATASAGGGIFAEGTCHINGGTIDGNEARYYGGGINSSGTLYIDGTTLTNNSARNGGAIRARALYIIDGIIDSNNASYDGGGLHIDSAGNLEMYNTSVTNNTSAAAAARGGGINILGNKTVILAGIKVNGNKATNSAGIAIAGGTVTFCDSGVRETPFGTVETGINEVCNNVSGSNSGGTGGIGIEQNAVVNMEQCDIKGNSAKSGGGITNNGTLTLNDVTITENQATATNSIDSSVTMGDGIYQNGTLNLKSYVNIQDSIYLMQDREINVAEKPVYHINEQTSVNVAVADTDAVENRNVISYDTRNKEQDAYSALSAGIYKINYIPDSDFQPVAKEGKIFMTGAVYQQRVKCVDTDGNPVSNAIFEVYRVTDSKDVKLGYSAVSDENGSVTITSLAAGQYYVSVISAPSEYEVNRAEKTYFETGSDEISITLQDADEMPVAVIVSDAESVAINEDIQMDGSYSSDDNDIVEYKWNFGDGTTATGQDASHSYKKEGTYEVELEVKDNKGNRSTELTEVKVKGTLENEYKITANIISSTTGEKIKDAVMIVSSEDGQQAGYVYADSEGKAEMYAPGGATYQISIYANGYYQRSTTLYLPMNNKEINVYLSDVNTVVGEITVDQMTYEEIVEAGIDVTDEANQNVSKQKVLVEFTTNFNESLYVEIIKYVNGEGKTVKEEVKDDDEGVLVIEQVYENFYLAIEQKFTWTKEMFNVQLLVLNNSQYEDIKDCEAQIVLPEGLSLASMKDETENQQKVTLGDIEKGKSKIHNWYVTGDAEGSYYIGAAVAGKMVNEEDESQSQDFYREYVSKEAVKVLGGSALFLEIEAETTTYRGDTYYIRYKLYNKSPIDIHNLTFTTEAQTQYRVTSKDTIFSTSYERERVTVDSLAPGDYIEVHTSSYIKFESLNAADPEYYLKRFVLESIGGNAGIPYSLSLKYIPTRVKPSKHISLTLKESSSADPVDMLTGSFTYQYKDASILGRNDLIYERTYGSGTAVDGRLGYGWKDSFDYSLERDEYNNLVLNFPDGDNVTFFYQEDYSYYAGMGSELTLEPVYKEEEENDGTEQIAFYSNEVLALPIAVEDVEKTIPLVEAEQYIVRHKDGEEYYFNKDYKITKTVDADGYETEYTYDEEGRLSQVSNMTGSVTFSWNTDNLVSGVRMSSGEEISYEYDENNLLSKITNSDGDSMTYEYDEDKLLKTITDFMGQKSIQNTYDKYGRVTKQSVLGEGDYLFTYDDDNKINTCTGENGYVHTIKYDSKNRIIEDTESGKSTYTYNDKNQRTSETDAQGDKKTYVYDTKGNVLKIKYSDGTTEEFRYNKNNKVTRYKNRNNKYQEYSYNSKNHVISETDFNGNETTYTYDGYGNVVMETHSDGSVMQYSYDGAGRKVAMTDGNGNVIKYKYDSAGREKRVEDASGGVTIYSYSNAGKLMSETDELGNTTYYDVNANGYNKAVTDKNGNKTTTSYNVQNKAVQTVSPLEYVNSYEYDSAGNMTKETDAEGNIKQYKYDAFGRVTEYTDAGGNLWIYTYDSMGRVTDIKNPKGDIATSTYDKDGNVISKKDESGNITEYTYDHEGNVLTETDSLGNVTEYEYDGNGNVTKKTDALGNETVNTYDALNRVIRTENSDGDVWTYTYDTVGNMIQESDAEGNVTMYNYDSMGRVVLTTDPEGNETSYTYDAAGNLKSTEYPDGGKLTYTYDANGNMTTVTDKNGLKESYVYDKENRLTEKTDKNGNKTTYEYDGNDNVTGETNAIGTEITRTYNPLGLLATETDAIGTKKYTYDVLGRLVTETGYGGNVTEYNYDKTGNVTSIKDGNGNVTQYEYDSVGNVSKMTKPDGGTVTYEYDACGNVKKETDGNSGVTQYEYDSEGRMTSKTDAEGNVWSWKYDGNGNLKEYTDAEGATTLYEYDKNGNNTKITNAEGRNTVMEYDSMNRLKKTKSHLGFTTTYEYDTNGNIVKETDAVKNETTYTYDANGNCTSKEKGGIKEEYTYDKANRLIKVTYADGTTHSYEYDIHDNMTSHTDKKGNKTLYEYDADGNMVKTTDALGNATEYEYDANGNVTKQILHRTTNGSVVDEITIYAYDGNNNVTQVTDAMGNVIKYEYDLNGNLKAKKDGEGNVLEQYSYTKTNLLKEKTDGEDVLAQYSYNKNGTVISMVTPETSITYTRDRLDRIVYFNQNNSYKVYYTYDADGRKTDVRYPDGLTVGHAYDGNGNIISTSHALGITSYTYDANGNKLTKNTESLDAGIKVDNTETYTYDIHGNLLTSTMTKSDGTVVPTDTYEYDAMGNVTFHREQDIGDGTVKSTACTYDELGRLTSETVTEGEDTCSTSYEYDSVGNLIKETKDGEAVIYEYNNLNQLVQKYNEKDYNYGYISAGYSYSYDEYGSLKSIVNMSGYKTEYSISSDSNGKMQSAVRNVNSGGLKNTVVSQVYDAAGNNVETKTTSTCIDKQTEYNVTKIYDYTEEVPKLLAEYDTDGTIKKYAYGAGGERILATLRTDRVQGFGMKLYTLYSDRLGSTRWALDREENVVSETEYTAWGEVTETSGVYISDSTRAADITASYTGYNYDGNLEWWNAGARMYAPQDKRFTSKDPEPGNVYEPLRVNAYIYAGDNPVTNIDPDGRSFEGFKNFIKGATETFSKVGCAIGKAVNEMDMPRKILAKITVGVIGAATGIGLGASVSDAVTTMFMGTALGAAGGGIRYTATASDWNREDYLNAVLTEGANAFAGEGLGVLGAGLVEGYLGNRTAVGNSSKSTGGSSKSTGKTGGEKSGKENTKNTSSSEKQSGKKSNSSNDENKKRQTPDQKALRDLAKEAAKSAKEGKPISEEEAKILDEWAEEYNVPQHHKAYTGSGTHFKGGNYSDHTHIYNIHVPYRRKNK